MSNTAVISTKGWVVIPKSLRRKYNLVPGMRVSIIDYGGGLSIVPLPDDTVSALQGLFGQGSPLTVDLLRERMRDRDAEESRP